MLQDTSLRSPGRLLLVLVAVLSHLLPLHGDEPVPLQTSLRIEPLQLNTATGSAMPNLTRTADGSVMISWVEPIPDGEGVRLRLSKLEDDGWADPVTAASGKNWFVNWADFPSAAVLSDGTIAVHWLDRISEETYAYGVKVSISGDQGKSWSEPIVPHRDVSSTEHGFVALRSLGDRFFLAWLDGRAMAGGASKPMSLRSTIIGADGERETDRLLDDRVCDCCPVDAVVQDDEVTVVYRDRDHLDVRDISWLKIQGGKVSDTGLVHEDLWVQEGCPVNGPSLAVARNRTVVAWYTGVDEILGKPSPEGAVLLRTLQGEGDAAEAPVRIDDGRPVGRVDLAALEDGSCVVCWLERKGDGAEVRVRRWRGKEPEGEVPSAHRLWSSHRIGTTSPGRRSGFPRIIGAGSSSAVVAWTETGVEGGTTVRTVRLPEIYKETVAEEK